MEIVRSDGSLYWRRHARVAHREEDDVLVGARRQRRLEHTGASRSPPAKGSGLVCGDAGSAAAARCSFNQLARHVGLVITVAERSSAASAEETAGAESIAVATVAAVAARAVELLPDCCARRWAKNCRVGELWPGRSCCT